MIIYRILISNFKIQNENARNIIIFNSQLIIYRILILNLILKKIQNEKEKEITTSKKKLIVLNLIF